MFWIVAHLGESDILSGPFETAQEANNEGFRASCPFDMYDWPTRDRARATQIYKRERFTRGSGLAESLERVKHEVSGKTAMEEK